MKLQKKLELLLIILICIAIAIIGFLGIYAKEKNEYVNKTGVITLASDLNGQTTLELEVDDTVDTVYYDENGTKVEVDEDTDTSAYTSKEEPVNPSENLTLSNYEKAVKIMNKRLKFLKTEQYNIDLDKSSGKIFVTFTSEYEEDVESILPMMANLQLKDENTGDTILDNSDFKSVNTTYVQTDDGYNVYFYMNLKKSGVEKIGNIDKYRTVEQTNTDEEDTETEEPHAVLLFDDDEIQHVDYDDMILTGKTLRLTLDEKDTTTSNVNQILSTATIVSKLSNIGRMPIKYSLSAEEYINSSINQNYIIAALLLAVAFLIFNIIYLIIKYKTKGLYASITTCAIIGIFILLVRITKINISLNSLGGIIAILIFNFMLVKNILNHLNDEGEFKHKIAKGYISVIDVLVVIIIAIIVFTFTSMANLSAVGLLMFWGIISTLLGNLALTVPTLRILDK